MVTKGRRRYRKNPSAMTWLLLLGGGAVAYYFLVHKKAAVPPAYQSVCVLVTPQGKVRRVRNHKSFAEAEREVRKCPSLTADIIEPGGEQLPEGNVRI